MTVQDDGQGIPPHLLTDIFELFRQVDPSPSRAQGGLGIGLTLVKRLVELHGGVIVAHSDGLGKGSQFMVSLPAIRLPAITSVATSVTPATNAAAENSKTGPRPRVLIVDDNRESAETLAEILRLRGHEALVAFDGASAIETLSSRQPDVVFLDLAMPEMSGYEVARQIRAQAEYQKLFLVALTGYGDEKTREQAQEAGFNDLVSKLADIEELEQLIVKASGDQVVHDVAVDIGQAEIAAGVREREPFVIHAQEPQERGM